MRDNVLPRTHGSRLSTAVVLICTLLLSLSLAHAQQQIDIPGPPGSSSFGTTVTALANGDIIVSGSDSVYLYSHAGSLLATMGGGNQGKVLPNGNIVVSGLGSVHLYDPTGAPISTLVGSAPGDGIGSGSAYNVVPGITVLSNGNFVVASPYWNGGRGAVTWVDGSVGLTGTVSASNSLVGSQLGDGVGFSGVVALSNGNYVVLSSYWANGAVGNAGAATWVNGSTGLAGAVSVANSLVGTNAGDMIGSAGVTQLANGNCVVSSPKWTGGAGAATWISGGSGLSGSVSAANSLVGSASTDQIGVLSSGHGSIYPLSNGSYVVVSPQWNGTAGAATWGSANGGVNGVVSAANSVVGSSSGDQIAYANSHPGVIELAGGHFAIVSVYWSNGLGAVTWSDSNAGITGAVSGANSLVGSSSNYYFGSGLTALPSGNVVTCSSGSDGGATFINANAPLPVGTATPPMSGIITGCGATVLSNGNFALVSGWDNFKGAVTWGDGDTGINSTVSAANSLVGSVVGDAVGKPLALANGNYVVMSASWHEGGAVVGAATWVDGSGPTAGAVSAANSLTDITVASQYGPIAVSAIALSNGNYLIDSQVYGTVTWGDGRTGIVGVPSASNSLIGPGWGCGDHTTTAFSDGNYAVKNPCFSMGILGGIGAVTLGRGTGGTVGPIVAANSVLGTVSNGGTAMVFDYDAGHATLIVGQPFANMISLFSYDPVFANGFE